MELGNGYRAIVARNYADIVGRAELVFRTLFRVMIATVLLGVIAGFSAPPAPWTGWNGSTARSPELSAVIPRKGWTWKVRRVMCEALAWW